MNRILLRTSFAWAITLGMSVGLESRQAPDTPRTPSAAGQGREKSQSDPTLPHGKKLVLKDGNFQLVREYQRNGDRVRYFSEERHTWEEIPAAMVDWDATAKAQA